VVRLEVGATVEVATVGKDGLFGAFAALDGKMALNTAIVQLAGVASFVESAQAHAAADCSPTFRALLIRHEQVIFAQALQTAACNASHSVQSRLARWLLRARDLADSNTLSFTQEFLAQMVGAQRNSISIAANALQKSAIITYTRGKIQILDALALKAISCECYDTINSYYDKLLAG
jgi:CRP-like cAMP-binding protein